MKNKRKDFLVHEVSGIETDVPGLSPAELTEWLRAHEGIDDPTSADLEELKTVCVWDGALLETASFKGWLKNGQKDPWSELALEKREIDRKKEKKRLAIVKAKEEQKAKEKNPRSDKGKKRSRLFRKVRSDKNILKGQKNPYKVFVSKEGKLTIILNMNSDEIHFDEIDSDYISFEDDNHVEVSCEYLSEIHEISFLDDKYPSLCRVNMKREGGDYTVGFVHYTVAVTFEEETYDFTESAIIAKYGDEADEEFGLVDHGEYDPANIGKVRTPVSSDLNAFHYNESNTEAKQELFEMEFHVDLDYSNRTGAVYLDKYEGTIAGTKLVQLSEKNIYMLQGTKFELMVNRYEFQVKEGFLPPNCHSLLLGNKGSSAVILNTNKPESYTDFNSNVWTGWKARAFYKDFGLKNYFVFADDLSSKIRNRKVFIVEGPNDGLTLFSKLQEIDSTAVVLCVGTSRISTKTINDFLSYIDWNSNDYTVFMDKREFSEGVKEALIKKIHLREESILIAQDIFSDLEEGEDPDEYCNRVGLSCQIQSHSTLEIDIESDKNSIDPQELYREYSELANVFMEFQPDALHKMGITDTELKKIPSVVDSEFYNSSDPEMKALIYATSKIDRNAVLELRKKKLAGNNVSIGIFSDEDFASAQHEAVRCKVRITPMLAIPKTYFTDEFLQERTKVLWEQCDLDIETVRLLLLKKTKFLRKVTNKKNTIKNDEGIDVDIIAESLSKQSGIPSLTYNTAALGAGKSLGIQTYIVDQALDHFRLAFIAVGVALAGNKGVSPLEFATGRFWFGRYDGYEPDELEEMTKVLSEWRIQIKPFIDLIEDKSWLDLDGDLSLSLVDACNLAMVLEILAIGFGQLPIDKPGLVIVNTNEEINGFSSLYSMLRLDSSTVQALNQENIKATPTTSVTVSHVVHPVVTLNRFKQSSFSSYTKRKRRIICDEKPSFDSYQIDEETVVLIMKIVRELDVPGIVELVDGFVDRLSEENNESGGEELESRIYEGDMDLVYWRLHGKILGMINDLTCENPALNVEQNAEYNQMKSIINILNVKDGLPKYLMTTPRENNRCKHELQVNEFISRLVETFLFTVLCQPDSLIAGDRIPTNNVRFMIPATLNEWLIFDGTANLTNPDLSDAFNDLRIAYPNVIYSNNKSIISNLNWYHCSGLIEPDTLIRDNYRQLLGCHYERETNQQAISSRV